MNIVSDRHRNRILLILFIGVLMGALDIAILAPALPAVQQSFGIDERSLAWIFSIYVLCNVVGTPLMAKLSDVRGRRPIYILDVTLFALGSLIVALSALPLSFPLLLLGRAIQGFGAGGIFPVASAVIGDTFPPEKRGSALGLIGAVFGLAFVVGPILGAIILAVASWPWLFVINLPIAAAIIVQARRWLPAPQLRPPQPFDLAGMATLALGLASLTYGVSQIETAHFFRSLGATAVWPFLAAALVLLALFWQIEQRAPDPILRVRLFASRQIRVLAGLAAGAGVGEATLVFVPSLLVVAFGVSESVASRMLLPAVLAMMVGAPLAGRLLDRIGSRRVVTMGSLALAAGMLLVGRLSLTLLIFYACAGLIGLGMGMLLGAPLRYIMLNETPPADRGAGQAALVLFTSTGRLLGSAGVGAIAASLGGGLAGFQRAYFMVGWLAILLALLALNLKTRAQEKATARG